MPKRAREKLTVQSIRYMNSEDGLGRDRADDGCLGLVLRVTGELGETRRTWFARYTVKDAGRRSLMKLGEYPQLDLKEARAKARTAIADARDGIDPKDVKRVEALKRKEETRATLDAPTFEAFADIFVERSKNERRKATWREDERYTKHLKKQFGETPITRIGKRQLSDFLEPFRTKPRVHNQYRLAMLSIFKVADEKEAVGENPVLRISPMRVNKPETNPLADRELKIVLPLLDENGQTGQIARLHLYTGQRPGHEIAWMRWDEIDFKAAIWRLPETRAKNGRAHEVPLSKQALRVLEKAKRSQSEKPSPLVFPSIKNPEIAFSHYAKPFRAVRTKAIENGATGKGKAGRPWSLYSFKDTMETAIEETGGFPFTVVAKIGNHQDPHVTRRYSNPDFKKPLREALEWWGSYCDRLEKGLSIAKPQ